LKERLNDVSEVLIKKYALIPNAIREAYRIVARCPAKDCTFAVGAVANATSGHWALQYFIPHSCGQHKHKKGKCNSNYGATSVYTSIQLGDTIWQKFIGQYEKEIAPKDIKLALEPYTAAALGNSKVHRIRLRIKDIIFGKAHENIEKMIPLCSRLEEQGYKCRLLEVNLQQMKVLALNQLRNLHMRNYRKNKSIGTFDPQKTAIVEQLARIKGDKPFLVGYQMIHLNFLRMRRGSGWDMLYLDASHNTGIAGGTNYSIQSADANRSFIPLVLGEYMYVHVYCVL
jgi:hypothetical protein